MKNRFLHAVLALLLSIALWSYVVTVENPETEVTISGIPVAMEGEALLSERMLMLTEGYDQTVTLTVSGSRSNINKLNRSNITVVADLSRIYDSGKKNNITYDIRWPGDTPDNAFTVQSRYPDSLSLTVENRLTQYVPVKIVYTGAVPQGYIADKENAVLDNVVITVKGPESVVKKIATANIEVEMTDRTESFREQYRYTLCDRDGNPVDVEDVTTNVDSVTLEMKIQNVKEVPLTVTVIDGGGATAETSSITVTPGTLRLAGSQQALEKLTEINLGTVNLGEILEDTVLTFPVNIDEELTSLSGEETATVEIKFPELMQKTFRVTEITPLNVPEGMEAQVETKVLDINVRGTKTQIAAMTEKDITVTVDFSGAEAGTYTVKPNVVINTRFADVGYLGSTSVSVTLAPTEKTEKP